MAACWHCEPDPVRQRWLDQSSYCVRCRVVEDSPQYDDDLVRSRLKTLLRWRKKGLFRASQINTIDEMADIEDGLRVTGQIGLLSALETNVLIGRLVQGLGRRTIAKEIGCSEATVGRALVKGVRKVADWLNGIVGADNEVEEEDDTGIETIEETKI